jgi:hypothetical protein
MLAPDKLNPRSGRRNWRSSLPLFELARVLLHLGHVASLIVNANHARGRILHIIQALVNVFCVDRVEILGLKFFGERLRVLSGTERRLLKWAVLNGSNAASGKVPV